MFTLLVLILPNIKKVEISTRSVVNWHKFQVKNFIVAKKSTRDLLEFVQF